MCHLRMVVMHLLIKFGADTWSRYLYPIQSYWHFSHIQDNGRRHLGFLDYVNLTIPACRQCGICAKFGSNIRSNQWNKRNYASEVIDNVTRINFRFRLLVTWSYAHGRDASSCKVRSYWHFSEIQDGGRRHLGFSDYVNLAIRACWQCGICVLYQIRLTYMHWLLRSTSPICGWVNHLGM